jgi:hypothetical protein
MSVERDRGDRLHVMTEEILDMIEKVQDPEVRKQVAFELGRKLTDVIQAANQTIKEQDPYYKSID